MNYYPTARNYRGAKPGTVREPGPTRRPGGPSPRRTPGRPPARPRPTYRPAPRPPAALPRPPALRPSPGALGAAASALRGFGYYGLAFSVGYAIGSIIFGPPPADALEISNPGNWDEYICSSPAGGSLFTSSVTYPIEVGVSAANCIGGQFAPVGPGTPLRIGYWQSYGPAANQNAHVASFLNSAGTATPIPELEVVPQPRPVIVTDPWFREEIGPGVRIEPGRAPVIMNPVGPEVVGRPTLQPRPVPGVGGQGYTSGEPSGNNRPDGLPSSGPSTNPVPRTNPNPHRPPRGVKERKVRGPYGVYQLFGRGYGFLTEVEDLLDAFHDSLKKGCGKGVTHKKQSAKAKPVWEAGGDTYRWKRIWTGKYSKWVRDKGQYRAPSFMEKWDAVYANFDCVDLGQFWNNYIDNQAEDHLIGSSNRDNPEASKRLRPGVRIGIGTGPAL